MDQGREDDSKLRKRVGCDPMPAGRSCGRALGELQLFIELLGRDKKSNLGLRVIVEAQGHFIRIGNFQSVWRNNAF